MLVGRVQRSRDMMVDMFTKERRSEIMARITDRDTKPEMVVRRLLHRMGLRFRLHGGDLPGRPDIVLPRWATVVFVHGCFWHGHTCKRGSRKRRPKSNASYWNPKIEGNMERDGKHARALRRLGWRRIVVWDCETADLDRLEARLGDLFPSHGRSQKKGIA
jgi:DNA mismatch endonuclease (patch repair protein)